MRTNAVFLGGVADGERRVIEGRPEFFSFAAHDPVKVRSFDDVDAISSISSMSFKHEDYSRRMIRSDDSVFVYYALISLSDADAVAKLIGGYRGMK
jgi:hypothetical protein